MGLLPYALSRQSVVATGTTVLTAVNTFRTYWLQLGHQQSTFSAERQRCKTYYKNVHRLRTRHTYFIVQSIQLKLASKQVWVSNTDTCTYIQNHALMEHEDRFSSKPTFSSITSIFLDSIKASSSSRRSSRDESARVVTPMAAASSAKTYKAKAQTTSSFSVLQELCSFSTHSASSIPRVLANLEMVVIRTRRIYIPYSPSHHHVTSMCLYLLYR